MLTQERLKELLHYDPETGIFTWKIKPNRSVILGSIAGSIKKSQKKTHIYKCREIKIDKKPYKAARLAYLYMHGHLPDGLIMCIDGDGLNNKFSNLLLSNHYGVASNRRLSSRSSTGVRGVCFDKKSMKYLSRINVDGKEIYIGFFKNLSDAIEARKGAEKKYGLYQADKEIMPDFAR